MLYHGFPYHICLYFLNHLLSTIIMHWDITCYIWRDSMRCLILRENTSWYQILHKVKGVCHVCCTLVAYETSVRACMAELTWGYEHKVHFFTLNISMAFLLILCNSISWQMPLLLENWAIYRFSCCWVHLDRRFREDLDTFQGGIRPLGDDVHTLPKSLVQILLTSWNSLSQ